MFCVIVAVINSESSEIGRKIIFVKLSDVLQGMNEMTNAVEFYKQVLHEDNMNVEAIASIATHHFYSDQPEIALNYYRQVLSLFSWARRFLSLPCFSVRFVFLAPLNNKLQ